MQASADVVAQFIWLVLWHGKRSADIQIYNRSMWFSAPCKWCVAMQTDNPLTPGIGLLPFPEHLRHCALAASPAIIQVSALFAMRQHLHAARPALTALQPPPDASKITIPITVLAELVERQLAQGSLMPAALAAHRQRYAMAHQVAGSLEAFRAHLPMRTKVERFGKRRAADGIE